MRDLVQRGDHLRHQRHVERQGMHRRHETHPGGYLRQGRHHRHGFQGGIPVVGDAPEPPPFGHRQQKIEPELLCQDGDLTVIGVGRWHWRGGDRANPPALTHGHKHAIFHLFSHTLPLRWCLLSCSDIGLLSTGHAAPLALPATTLGVYQRR